MVLTRLRGQLGGCRTPISNGSPCAQRPESIHMERQRPDIQIGMKVRIPAMPITDSNLTAIRIPRHADHFRSEATLGCSYHRELIAFSQLIRF